MDFRAKTWNPDPGCAQLISFLEMTIARLTMPIKTRRLMIYRARILPVAAVVLALTGCQSTPRLGGDPKLQVLPNNELPVPVREDLASSTSPYYIGPYDKLIIDVYGITELSNREVQVDAAGRLSFPLAGEIDAAGKTPREIQSEIALRLQQGFVRSPQVTVNMKETVSRVVTIDGQVRKPGRYPVVGRMTLMGAVATAEGTDEFSKLDDVVIFRTVNGQRYAALYDLDAIRHGAYSDPEIYASDVIMVGDSRARHLFKDLLAIVPAIATPLVIAVDRFTN